MIITSLSNITTEEHKTVNLECVVMATTMPGWTWFSWLKNNDTISANPKKYRNNTEINPYKDNDNSIKFILTIYNVVKEDRGSYTLIVYYDGKVLKEFGIKGEFVNQTTGSVRVDTNSEGLCLSTTFMLVYYYYVCRQQFQRI